MLKTEENQTNKKRPKYYNDIKNEVANSVELIEK